MKLAIKDVGYNRLVFGEILRFGFGAALGLFTAVELTLALLSLRLFRSEVPACAT